MYQSKLPAVYANGTTGNRIWSKSASHAQDIIEMFGLSHLAQRHPHSLSEGQKRRVSIAAVVAANPSVLLLDEPSVGQDYAGLREMLHILNRLHEQSENTMITITHDMRCAEALCDHAVLISDGVVAERRRKSTGPPVLLRGQYTEEGKPGITRQQSSIGFHITCKRPQTGLFDHKGIV